MIGTPKSLSPQDMFGGSNTYSIGIWMSRVNEMILQASNNFGAIYAMILGPIKRSGPTKRVRDWDPFNRILAMNPPTCSTCLSKTILRTSGPGSVQNSSWFMNKFRSLDAETIQFEQQKAKQAFDVSGSSMPIYTPEV